jgi:hypothetical protein
MGNANIDGKIILKNFPQYYEDMESTNEAVCIFSVYI